MSIKGKTFQANLGNPLNTHNFIVRIADPGNDLSKIQMLVTATSYPVESMQEYTMFFQGERVKFPSIPTNSGSWKCSAPEGEFAKVQTALKTHAKKNYDQVTGRMTYWAPEDKFDIEILAKGLRGDVNGSDTVFGVKLIGCFLVGKEEVSLSSEAATTPWVWGLNFSYDSIEELDITPLGPPNA